jgi:Protein of unknown function (DUF1566)
MHNQTKKILLVSLLVLVPLTHVAAQTCKTASIPASSPTTQFTDNKNGSVTNKKTGLTWKKCSEGQIWNRVNGKCTGTAASYGWKAALNRATVINRTGGFLGKTDWRLPNIKELASIVEEQCYSPAINLAVFPATPAAWFWASSPDVGVGGVYAWGVNFVSGGDDWADKNEFGGQFRLVRTGL